ncbi:MAG: hypothetical protein ACTSXL_03695 [Alphaproteobacteria bacterium]|nr:MAG: hypothetical protein B6I23_01855 [Rickettsiaceae bacterium 4572_127]
MKKKDIAKYQKGLKLIKKDTILHMRMNEKIIKMLARQAKASGLRYQTYISVLLYKQATEDLQ